MAPKKRAPAKKAAAEVEKVEQPIKVASIRVARPGAEVALAGPMMVTNPSVVLVAPDSTTVTVTTLQDFYAKIYTLGYTVQSGSVHSNYLILKGLPPANDPNEVLRLSDVTNSQSAARTALGAALVTVDTTQTITGAKDFTIAPTVNGAAMGGGGAAAPSIGSLINVTAAPYNAKGDGATDDSAAIAAARDAVLASRDGSGHATKPGLYFPAGTYLITTPDALMNATSTAGDVIDGYTIRGDGKRTTTINFRPAGTSASLTDMNLMTWENTSTGGRVKNFRCLDIAFDCNNTTASFLYSYSVTTSANYDAKFHNVMWSGTWNRVVGLDGSDTAANLNSEMGFYNCETWSPTAAFTDAFFNSCCTPADTSNQQDQFVDYWFRDCMFGWQSGTLLKFPKGGSVGISGGSWSALGATCLMISMPFHHHNSGAQRLLVSGVRIELAASGARIINCEWFGGVIEWLNVDESGEAFQSWAPTTKAHRYDWGVNNTLGNGPSVTYRGCHLMGYHEVATGATTPVPGKIRYDGCLFYNYYTGQITTTTGASGLLRWTGAGVPAYSFHDCFGLIATIADAPAPAGETAINPAFSDVIDDLVGGNTTSGTIGALGWALVGGTASRVNAEAGHPGIVQVSTGAVSGTLAAVYLDGTVLGSDLWDLTFWVKAVSVDSSTKIRVGWSSDPTADVPTVGAYFEKLAADTNWFLVTRVASLTGTRTDTGVAAAAGWLKFRVRNINTSSFGFTIGSGSELTMTQYLAGASEYIKPMVQITNSAAAAKTINVDRAQLLVSGLTR